MDTIRDEPRIAVLTRRQAAQPLLVADSIDEHELIQIQKNEFPDEWQQAESGESIDYSFENGVLVSDTLPYAGAEFTERSSIIDKSHEAVGHMATAKTLRRIAECYVWPGARKEVRARIKQCTICQTAARTVDRVPIGEMPTPTRPMEMIGLFVCLLEFNVSLSQ